MIWAGNPFIGFNIATSTNKEICSQDSPKGGENEESIGGHSITTGNKTRTSSTDQRMAYLCVCGREFVTQRGMKIHRTKKGCLRASMGQKKRTVSNTDKTSENQSQVQNHSVEVNHSDDPGGALNHSINAKRHKINFPPANDKRAWDKLDSELAVIIKEKLNKSSLLEKLDKFGDVIYEFCVSRFGTKHTEKKITPKENRRQREMRAIRQQKKAIKKQMKKATEIEKQGLEVIWKELKGKHSALSKAESIRKKRSKKKRTRDSFFQNPYHFARQLFEQPKSGSLDISKEALEQHLRQTYSDPLRNEPLPDMNRLVWPTAPGTKFNCKPPTIQEVRDIVRKARAKSSPGPNGVPYLVYKRCPAVLGWLHKLIRSAWRNQKVPDQWMKAEGIYIPKEQNSRGINQFRPISLLNVEGKIFFAVMASRLTKYLIQNGYIDTSIQKGGIPGISGCLEHATMIWEAIQRGKLEKLNLDVVWLDLANAYGSVPHAMIQQALKMYHIPDNVVSVISSYFDGFKMRFSNGGYTTEWIKLEVGIAMGCTISPILFILAMQMILKAAEKNIPQADLGSGCSMPPLKAFMDDTTITSSDHKVTREILARLDDLMKWCRMSFKPKKSRSLSLRKGKVATEIYFQVAGQLIPTVSDEPIKSLGRWYDSSLKDTKRAKETLDQAAEGLKTIERCGLPGKFKVWCLQFILIPKLLWPLLIYDIPSSLVESMEAKINKFTRKWLGVPPGLSDVALYCREAKLKLPFKSILEEYKCGKVRLMAMLEDSEDPVVRNTQPAVRTGRKWIVSEEVNMAKENLRMKEVIGHTQTDRRGLGHSKMRWWSKAKGKEKRDMVIEEIRRGEDRKRVQKAVGQPQQGQWTSWESAVQRSVSWNDLWTMAPLRVGFLIRSVYDLLPTNANLVRWGKANDPTCPLCSGKQTTQHVLSSCRTALAQGRYTWRHNRVLETLTRTLETGGRRIHVGTQPATVFKSAGKAKSWVGRDINLATGKTGLLDGCDDWKLSADLPKWERHPEIIRRSGLRPDIVLFSPSTKRLILIELTVPYESRMDEAHTFKNEKYKDLAISLEHSGFPTTVMPVEVGARGFIGSSAFSLLSRMSIRGSERRAALQSLAEAAESSSSWIWARRNDNRFQQQ